MGGDLDKIMRLRRWEKWNQFDSILPNRLVLKLESEDQGCFKLKFSRYGKYLAACCTLGNNRTIIKIYDIEKDYDNTEPQAILPGHADLIHDIDWSPDD
jgi:WD40 repeat protein